LQALAAVSRLDFARTIQIAKAVLARYSTQTEAGMQHCCETEATIITDIHIWTDNAEAAEFTAQQIKDISQTYLRIQQWLARHSDTLMVGNIADPSEPDHAVRLRTLAFYGAVLDAAFDTIEALDKELDILRSGAWPPDKQETLRAMISVLDEATMRFYFASAADNANSKKASAAERARFYKETKRFFEQHATVFAVHVSYYLIQALEAFIPADPPGVFTLIAQSVRASERRGGGLESLSADLIVRIVERYLADHREVFARPDASTI
jgi:hypothetical protein